MNGETVLFWIGLVLFSLNMLAIHDAWEHGKEFLINRKDKSEAYEALRYLGVALVFLVLAFVLWGYTKTPFVLFK